MPREITQEQFDALEAEHGKGNVLVLTTEDQSGDEFAFRRFTADDVTRMLAWKDDARADFLAAGMRLALLSPDAPAGGKGPVADSKLSAEAKSALIAERNRLAAVIKAAPAQEDVLSVSLARLCGYGWKYEVSAEDKSLLVISPRYGLSQSCADETFTLTARPLEAKEYAEYRRLSQVGAGGEDDRYAFRVAASGLEKDELARLYAWLPIAAGQAIAGMGSARGVTLKKFASSSPAPKE